MGLRRWRWWWFPPRRSVRARVWLFLCKAASAFSPNSPWWELGFHLNATLQSIRLSLWPPMVYQMNSHILIFTPPFTIATGALPYFPFALTGWKLAGYFDSKCCVFALRYPVCLNGGYKKKNQLLSSQSLNVCAFFLSNPCQFFERKANLEKNISEEIFINYVM